MHLSSHPPKNQRLLLLDVAVSRRQVMKDGTGSKQQSTELPNLHPYILLLPLPSSQGRSLLQFFQQFELAIKISEIQLEAKRFLQVTTSHRGVESGAETGRIFLEIRQDPRNKISILYYTASQFTTSSHP